MKKIRRRAFLGGVAGGTLGFLGIKPEDSQDEAVGKVVGTAAVGAGIGAVSGAGDAAHDAVTRPTEQDIADTRSHQERSFRQFLKDRAAERSGEKNNDERNR